MSVIYDYISVQSILFSLSNWHGAGLFSGPRRWNWRQGAHSCKRPRVSGERWGMKVSPHGPIKARDEGLWWSSRGSSCRLLWGHLSPVMNRRAWPRHHHTPPPGPRQRPRPLLLLLRPWLPSLLLLILHHTQTAWWYEAMYNTGCDILQLRPDFKIKAGAATPEPAVEEGHFTSLELLIN